MQDLLAQYLFHWTPERAIWLGENTLSWDARCAGIYAGVGSALLFHLLVCRVQFKLPSRPVMVTAAVLVLPMFIDVFTIHFHLRPAINGLRHLTGVLFGISFCSLLYPAVGQMVASPEAANAGGLTLRKFLVLAVLGSLFSFFTQWDRLFSYYLLESLSWAGFVGLVALVGTGLAGTMLKKS